MIDIQTLTLLPQDQLALINGIELQAFQRYHSLALRFLTYDTTLSRHMEGLRSACERRLEAWWYTAEYLGLAACVDTPEALRFQAPMAEPRDRFFIFDEATVDQTLREALATSLATHIQARRLLGANGTPELERPLLEYVDYKQWESDVLMHCCAPLWPCT